VFLFLAVLLYFLVGGPRIAGRLLWLVPPKQRTMVQHLWSKIAPVLRRYFIGLSIVVCYGAAAAYIGLGLVLDLPGAVVLAMLTGILELIPLLGPAASALLAGVVAIHSATGIGALIGYGVYAAVLRVSIDQIIGPIVLGKSAYLHPVLIIFCFLAGGYLFGVVGLLMAVPVALTIRIVLHELYEGPGFHVGEPEETEGGRHG
jgi:predicted PurR-regulated permease PerM